MAKRCNHYDVAFEQLLRLIRRPYVSVHEQRRALSHDESLKSMDFIVSTPDCENLLIDVKGRRFEQGAGRWKNWTTADDVDSLMRWEGVFGEGFRALFVFAYEIASRREVEQHPLIWNLCGRRYAFYGVWAREYAEQMKVCSPSWKTVSLPALEYRRLRRPLLDVL